MSSNLKGIQSIEEIPLEGKSVFIRVDFNVPVSNGKITDDSRITGAIPTIKYAVENGAKVILGSHFGRPKTKADHDKYSLDTVAVRLQELTGYEVILVSEPESEAPKVLLKTLKPNQILLLENLRFSASETKNTTSLVEAITRYADIYINDAFGASHRAHASIVGLPQAISDHGIGYLMKKEIEVLEGVLENPQSPYWTVMGGAKVSDKILLIETLISKVDGFIIGGAMAYTFLAAQGHPVGDSLVEKDQLQFARRLLERLETRGKQFLLPVDHKVATDIGASEEDVKTTGDMNIPEGFKGFDIGPKTIKLFENALSSAKTIFWNGPMGVFENDSFNRGTYELARIISECEGAVTVVGGGDSASAARKSGFADKFTHISTGGGASLEFLQGMPLPGVLALQGRYKEHIGKK